MSQMRGIKAGGRDCGAWRETTFVKKMWEYDIEEEFAGNQP